MKTVEIVESFDAYPNGKTKVPFRAGETPEVSNDFADLITGKGHAVEKAGTKKDDVT